MSKPFQTKDRIVELMQLPLGFVRVGPSFLYWSVITTFVCLAFHFPLREAHCDEAKAHSDDAHANLPNGDREGVKLFNDRILPTLKQHCFECHSAQSLPPEGGLRLDLRDGIHQGGDKGPAVAPGDAASSLLLSAIRHEDLVMPPEGDALPSEVIEDFRRWIELGAPDPRAPTNEPIEAFDFEKEREFWLYQPIDRPAPPSVAHQNWPANWIDRFILAKLESSGLQPAPPASKADLIRRVYFDVTGLPPSPEQLDEFLSDDSPHAYEELVDRLLASSHYGERAAQHWLDVVRFAESEGFEYDRHLPDAWRYRDYVIRSFNEDKPYDRFVAEQIAGDELAIDADGRQRVNYLTGAVMHRLGAVRRNAGNQLVAASRNEVLTERADIVGSAFLGLTVGCARCHDHKFDAISQEDYYRFQAFFASTFERNAPIDPNDDPQADLDKRSEIGAQLQKLKQRVRGLKGEEKAAAQREIAQLEAEMPPPPPVIPAVANDHENRTAIHVLVRGDWDQKGPEVGARGLSVISGTDAPQLSGDVEAPRTQLAKWLTGDAAMVTARVYVNRVWRNYFGRGIVNSPNNFGKNGQLPSHPELLDALAASFLDNGWRTKPLIRMMLLSSVYRQASRSPIQIVASESDPENRLLWKVNRRRLSAEEIRDAMLSVSGRLNCQAGGPSVIVPVQQELVKLLYHPEQWEVTPDAAEHDRRSIYLISKRNLRLPFMEVFDQPIAQISCAARQTTTHAPQILELLNGEFTNDVARSFAKSLQQECGPDTIRQVDRAFLLAAGRTPTDQERALSARFLGENSLDEFALAILNTNEFFYVD